MTNSPPSYGVPGGPLKRPCRCIIFPGSSGVACMPEDVSFAMSSSSFIMRRCVAMAELWAARRGGGILVVVVVVYR